MPALDLSLRSTSVDRRPTRRLSFLRLLDLWRSRQALRRLDDSRLADIGLSPSEAEAEAQKPVWDVPDTWRSR